MARTDEPDFWSMLQQAFIFSELARIEENEPVTGLVPAVKGASRQERIHRFMNVMPVVPLKPVALHRVI